MIAKDRNYGFTIFELLAVVAVISILSLLLFPVMLTAIRSAKVSRSMSNMRQINYAIQLYVQSSGKDSQSLDAYPYLIPNELYEFGIKPEIMDTKGVTSDASPPPYGYLIGGLLFDRQYERWQTHLARTNGNPLILIDATQEQAHDDFDYFSPRLAFAIYGDGHIVKKHLIGEAYRLEPWKK